MQICFALFFEFQIMIITMISITQNGSEWEGEMAYICLTGLKGVSEAGEAPRGVIFNQNYGEVCPMFNRY
jgi:hypothetical protein